jgi:hypothetical protein
MVLAFVNLQRDCHVLPHRGGSGLQLWPRQGRHTERCGRRCGRAPGPAPGAPVTEDMACTASSAGAWYLVLGFVDTWPEMLIDQRRRGPTPPGVTHVSSVLLIVVHRPRPPGVKAQGAPVASSALHTSGAAHALMFTGDYFRGVALGVPVTTVAVGQSEVRAESWAACCWDTRLCVPSIQT